MNCYSSRNGYSAEWITFSVVWVKYFLYYDACLVYFGPRLKSYYIKKSSYVNIFFIKQLGNPLKIVADDDVYEFYS